MSPRYTKLLDEVELKDLKSQSQSPNQLLDSFDTPDEGQDTDSRLSQPDMSGSTGGSAADEIDRNIHSAIGAPSASRTGPAGASSSETGPSASGASGPSGANSTPTSPSGAGTSGGGMDLESQTLRLTKTQRVMNVLTHLVPIKQTYERIHNGLATGRMQPNIPGRFIGQGTDGVFRNLMAKPDANSNAIKSETNPPTYEEAAADSTPEYWETSVIAPIYEDEVFVEGLPVGNLANFVWNGLVTVAFQFVGFLLCYLLHTSHAAKHGSRAGLGITFIFYGWNLVPSNFGNSNELPEKYEPKNPNNYNIDENSPIDEAGLDDYTSSLLKPNNDDAISNTPYFAYGLIAFGLLMILKAGMDYYRVKQMERVILHPPGTNSTSIVSENLFDHQENPDQSTDQNPYDHSPYDPSRNESHDQDQNQTEPSDNTEHSDNEDTGNEPGRFRMNFPWWT